MQRHYTCNSFRLTQLFGMMLTVTLISSCKTSIKLRLSLLFENFWLRFQLNKSTHSHKQAKFHKDISISSRCIIPRWAASYFVFFNFRCPFSSSNKYIAMLDQKIPRKIRFSDWNTHILQSKKNVRKKKYSPILKRIGSNADQNPPHKAGRKRPPNSRELRCKTLPRLVYPGDRSHGSLI